MSWPHRSMGMGSMDRQILTLRTWQGRRTASALPQAPTYPLKGFAFLSHLSSMPAQCKCIQHRQRTEAWSSTATHPQRKCPSSPPACAVHHRSLSLKRQNCTEMVNNSCIKQGSGQFISCAIQSMDLETTKQASAPALVWIWRWKCGLWDGQLACGNCLRAGFHTSCSLISRCR